MLCLRICLVTQVAGGATGTYLYRQRLKDNKAVTADDFNAAQPKAADFYDFIGRGDRFSRLRRKRISVHFLFCMIYNLFPLLACCSNRFNALSELVA